MIKRDQTLSVRLSVEELAMLTVMAAGAGCEPEEFLRSCIRRFYRGEPQVDSGAEKE